ncbi:MAG: flagellar type III secretion system pore protein FliP [Candidatus Scalindua rubra]|uniref:Flagellar biosynthetic protein FliP n=1 Tax=Candidatus Scalindua brodae TaxID=237368 RepID=A0A0B0ENM4_9BACT|nr:MAG: polar flagellar assembly protein FliP [Candidatus Scalindua brodae]MBZ0107218.1 flagellar type III secretion system pore protein FliP [Candidatus Scalindua rubra]TWU31657.1 Flagellar biosynthetic protein FliP precursor [Candidatus Brocadiaceae bacterium S225]
MKYLLIMFVFTLSFGTVMFLAHTVAADDAVSDAMNMTINMGSLNEPKQVAGIVKVLLVMTSFTFLPGLLMVMTSFTRIIIVLGFVRKAISSQQMPPNQILIGLAILITFFVMAPVFSQINKEAIQPFMQEEIDQGEAFERGIAPLKTFMAKQTREKDIALFYNIAEMERPASLDDVPAHIILPAFVVSELKTAFQMGFVVYLPFIVIDMVVASVLTSMGMFMLPPMMISVPFKIVLFVLVDGWHLIIQSLVSSIR